MILDTHIYKKKSCYWRKTFMVKWGYLGPLINYIENKLLLPKHIEIPSAVFPKTIQQYCNDCTAWKVIFQTTALYTIQTLIGKWCACKRWGVYIFVLTYIYLLLVNLGRKCGISSSFLSRAVLLSWRNAFGEVLEYPIMT